MCPLPDHGRIIAMDRPDDVGVHELTNPGFLCATSVFSVFLWFTLPKNHHRDPENTEVAQRRKFN